MNKLSQEEIDRLANQSDEDHFEQEHKDKHQKELEEEIENHFDEDFEEKHQESPLNQASEVQSEIEEENNDEIGDQIVSEEHSRDLSKFKNDEDLSLAKSQFVQSQQLNINSNLKERKEKLIKKVSKDKVQAPPKKEITKPGKKQEKKVAKPPSRGEVQDEGKKKEKLSESEINRRMAEIKKQREQIQKKKEQKKKREQDIRKKEYQQAKKIQEEKKEKNKKILEQQKMKKKQEKTTKPKSEVKINNDQIKIPEKKQITYQNMVIQRKKMEREIQKKIEADNKIKLQKLLEKPQSELKGQAKKEAFKKEKEHLKDRERKMRQIEVEEEDTVIVKQLKKEINESKKFNLEKQDQINRAEKTIADLTKKLGEKEKIFYAKYSRDDEDIAVPKTNYSELSPIEKFVYCFPNAKTSNDIFNLIDRNGDGILSSEEIKQKLQQYHLQPEVIQKVQDLLDENSDGTVSNEQFVFFVDREMKRQKDYRQIMGVLQMNDPLDLQAHIIDMQAKIRFINEKIEKYDSNKNSGGFDQKLQKLQKKAKKLEQQWKKQIKSINQHSPEQSIGVNTTANLTNEIIRLKNEKNMKSALLQKLKTKVKDNLSEKNKLLASRVEENLRLEQQVFKIKNDIQESELRYLSMKKIKENKKGYLQRQSQKQKQLEEAYKKTKQYKIAIADPSKKAQNAAERDQMRLLAAVLMIQRNFRRRKARGEFEKLKAERG